MRVGIVTQPLARNYGGILQNYALQQTLIRLGHIPYTFDLGVYNWRDWAVISVKTIVKRLLCRSCSFPETPIAKRMTEQPLRSFVSKHISLISPRLRRLSVDKIREYELDAIVVGSDQVWRPMYNYFIQDMYLDFARDVNIKKIAYAASFGTDKWEYTDAQTAACRDLTQRFDAISVREKSGIDLCRKHLKVDATQLLDPTLLLTVEDYSMLLTNIPETKTPYLFAYILDPTEEKIKYIKSCANEMGLDIQIKGADQQLSVNDSVENWLAHFRDAKYIITDSFHGSVFSIIFNKPFIAFGNNMRGASRFESLFTIFGLQDRLIDLNKSNALSSDIIDWDAIKAKNCTYRKESIEFLRANL